MTITRRRVTVTSADGTWAYDGAAHSNATVTVSGDGFVPREWMACGGFATITDEGTCPNSFTYAFNAGTHTGNYEIASVFGTLTVTAAPPHRVVFDTLGGRIGSAVAVTQTVRTAYGALPEATRGGYRFAGWFLGVTNGAPGAVAGGDVLAPGDPSARKYAATRTVTETVVTPSGTQARLDGSNVDRPLGVKANLGYDIWSTERFALRLNLSFAAYWNMRSAASGFAGGGRIDVRRTTEYYLFGSGPIPDDTDFTSFQPDAEPYRRDAVDLAPTELAERRLHARIRSDLYQIGLGPQATWHVCGGLDAYGRVEALCSLAHLDFDTGVARTAETKCLPGVGGTVGLAASIAGNVALYAEAGYEWIDAAETKLGRARAEVDFSGLVLGAGVVVSF